MNTREKDNQFRDYHLKPYRPKVKRSWYYNQHYQNGQREWNDVPSSDEVFSDRRFLDIDRLHLMEEVKNLPTARDFLSWMRQKFARSVPRDRLVSLDFDTSRPDYQFSDRPRHWQKYQDYICSSSMKKPQSGNQNNNDVVSAVFNDGSTYCNHINSSKTAIASNSFKSNVHCDRIEMFISENQCNSVDGHQSRMKLLKRKNELDNLDWLEENRKRCMFVENDSVDSTDEDSERKQYKGDVTENLLNLDSTKGPCNFGTDQNPSNLGPIKNPQNTCITENLCNLDTSKNPLYHGSAENLFYLETKSQHNFRTAKNLHYLGIPKNHLDNDKNPCSHASTENPSNLDTSTNPCNLGTAGNLCSVDTESQEKPYNLSKNPDQEYEVKSALVEEVICFAPFEEYDTELEQVDENSLLAQHQRNFRILSQGKRLKAGHVPNGQINHDQFQFNTCNSKFNAEHNGVYLDTHKGRNEDEFHAQNIEEDNCNQFEDTSEKYLEDMSEQNEAIDYSLKLEQKCLEKLDIDTFKNSASERLSRYPSVKRCSEPVQVHMNLHDNNGRNMRRQASFETEDRNGKNMSNQASINKEVRRVERISNQVSIDENKNAETALGISEATGLCRLSSKQENEKQSEIVKSKSGFVNSVAKLGFCLPFVQKRQKEKLENSAYLNRFEPDFKTQCEEFLGMFTYSKVKENNVSNDKGNHVPYKRKGKRTLEEVIDTMITDIMDHEESL